MKAEIAITSASVAFSDQPVRRKQRPSAPADLVWSDQPKAAPRKTNLALVIFLIFAMPLFGGTVLVDFYTDILAMIVEPIIFFLHGNLSGGM